MNAKDIMTHRVVTISENATVLDAAQLMIKRRISGLPVVDADGALIGVITEGDLMRRTEIGTQKRAGFLATLFASGRAAEDFTHSHGRFIREVMSSDPVSVSEDTSLEQIVTIFQKKRIRRVPVLRDGHVVGLVSRANLLKALVKNAQYPHAVAANDREIRAKILSDMEANAWAPTAMVEINVNSGVVTLSGTILDERDRAALKVLAENIPGVHSVRDDLLWIEPSSGFVLGGDDVRARI